MPKRRRNAKKPRPADWCITAKDMRIKERIDVTKKALYDLHHKKQSKINTAIVYNEMTNAIKEDIEIIKNKIETKCEELKATRPELNNTEFLEAMGLIDCCLGFKKGDINNTLCRIDEISDDELKLLEIVSGLKQEFDEDERKYIEKYPTHCEMFGIEKWLWKEHQIGERRGF